jgi:hypothetical protein
MRNLFVTGVSVVALSFGAASLAQANHSLSSNLGGGFLEALADGMEEDGAGVWTNFSVNNDGQIASAVSATEESFALGLEIDSSSAANTTNTAASSSFESAFGIETSSAASGPMQGVFAANFAYNNATVDGSILVTASDVNVGGAATLAAGAINTGTISMGFDGSALNSALNVD